MNLVYDIIGYIILYKNIFKIIILNFIEIDQTLNIPKLGPKKNII